jgi:hypothetical protein
MPFNLPIHTKGRLVSVMRSIFSSNVPDRPEDFCFVALPVSLNSFNQWFRAFSSGALSPGNNFRPLRYIPKTDFNPACYETNSAF